LTLYFRWYCSPYAFQLSDKPREDVRAVSMAMATVNRQAHTLQDGGWRQGRMDEFEKGEIKDIDEVIDVAVGDIQDAIFSGRTAAPQPPDVVSRRGEQPVPPYSGLEASEAPSASSSFHNRNDTPLNSSMESATAADVGGQDRARLLASRIAAGGRQPEQQLRASVQPYNWKQVTLPAGQAASSGNFVPFSVAAALAALVFAAARFGREAAKAERLDARRLEVVVDERQRRAAAAARARGEDSKAAEARIRAAQAKVRHSRRHALRPVLAGVLVRQNQPNSTLAWLWLGYWRLSVLQATAVAAETQRQQAEYAAASEREAARARVDRERARRDYEAAEARQTEELAARREVEVQLAAQRAEARRREQEEAQRAREVRC
jgi:hypothetical protein